MSGLLTIDSSDLLAGLSEDQLRHLDELASERRLASGARLFQLGDDADRLFIVGAGTVELTLPLRVLGEIKEVKFEALGPGRALAWSALVPPHRLTMNARAASAVVLASLPRRELFALFDREPGIARVMLGNLSRVIGSRLIETQALWVRELQRNVAHGYT